MQNRFDHSSDGFGMLFSQNLALKEYYDSLFGKAPPHESPPGPPRVFQIMRNRKIWK